MEGDTSGNQYFAIEEVHSGNPDPLTRKFVMRSMTHKLHVTCTRDAWVANEFASEAQRVREREKHVVVSDSHMVAGRGGKGVVKNLIRTEIVGKNTWKKDDSGISYVGLDRLLMGQSLVLTIAFKNNVLIFQPTEMEANPHHLYEWFMKDHYAFITDLTANSFSYCADASGRAFGFGVLARLTHYAKRALGVGGEPMTIARMAREFIGEHMVVVRREPQMVVDGASVNDLTPAEIRYTATLAFSNMLIANSGVPIRAMLARSIADSSNVFMGPDWPNLLISRGIAPVIEGGRKRKRGD